MTPDGLWSNNGLRKPPIQSKYFQLPMILRASACWSIHRSQHAPRWARSSLKAAEYWLITAGSAFWVPAIRACLVHYPTGISVGHTLLQVNNPGFFSLPTTSLVGSSGSMEEA